MKKHIALLLVLIMIVLQGCGTAKKAQASAPTPEPTKTPKQIAYDISKEAYANIDSAYEILNVISSDIYETWRIAINEKNNIKKLGENTIPDDAIKVIADELYLSKEDFISGLKHYYLLEFGIKVDDEEYYNSLDDDMRETIDKVLASFDNQPDFMLHYKIIKNDSLFSVCVDSVVYAYEDNGLLDKVETLLTGAKQQMKQLSADYSDYEHYPSLKGYFTNTMALFDFCKSPEGSFEQLKDTINGYRNEARKYQNDLDYIFED